MRYLPVHVLSLLAIVFNVCKKYPEEQVIRLVSEWSGKEIHFPNRSIFTSLGKDTVDSFNEASKYRIISYPVHNVKVEELYLSLLTRKIKDASSIMKTSVELNNKIF